MERIFVTIKRDNKGYSRRIYFSFPYNPQRQSIVFVICHFLFDTLRYAIGAKSGVVNTMYLGLAKRTHKARAKKLPERTPIRSIMVRAKCDDSLLSVWANFSEIQI